MEKLPMKRTPVQLMLGCLMLLLVPAGSWAEEQLFTRTRDVIYGRKYGLALTLDVFTPKQAANGAAVIAVVSGGWFSAAEAIHPDFYRPFLKRGYTVFAVVHGSNPKFTIPEAIADLHRSVRFIRHHAKDYKIDPERIGITGGSAGGHLALMQGTAGDAGNPNASDPVDRVSSRVQAVACFFPPTDFLNYGEKGKDVLASGVMDRIKLRAPFAFQEFDNARRVFVPVTDEKKVRAILRRISPITHVSAEDAPALIIHGDKDAIVPIQQAKDIVARFKEVGVPARLVVKKGADHGWRDILKDMDTLADWFDKYLAKKSKDEGKKNPDKQGSRGLRP
jgi:acetyl esterase/lipase